MRYPSIDILRAISIVLMVLVHFVENLSVISSSTLWMPAGFAAPTFTFLTGLSYRLWIGALEKRGRSDEDISKSTLRRGLFLIGLGFAFNVLVWLPEDTFNWDILTFIGTAWLLLEIVRRTPTGILVAACLIVFVMSPWLRLIADYPAYWTNSYFECDLTFADVLQGFLVTGYFPLFPWIILPIIGFLMGSALLAQSENQRPFFALPLSLGLALIAIAIGLVSMTSGGSTSTNSLWLAGWTMFPASPAYLTGTLGFTLVAFASCHRWIDGNPRFSSSQPLLRLCSLFSRHSLSIYLLHHVIHLWPLWLYGIATGNEPTYFWRIAMPPSVSLPLACLFLVVSAILFRWIDRTGKPTLESLMRWLCD